MCWEQPLLPVWTLHLGIECCGCESTPTPPNTQTASLPVGWLALTPWCNRQTEALLLKASQQTFTDSGAKGQLWGGMRWERPRAKELLLLGVYQQVEGFPGGSVGKSLPVEATAGGGDAKPSAPPGWGASGQHRALHKSSSVKHGLPPRVSSWEQLGRKEKDKKPADSTMSRWPSFQKRKRSPLLKCFSMEMVAAGCSGWVFDPGPPAWLPSPEPGMARETWCIRSSQTAETCSWNFLWLD